MCITFQSGKINTITVISPCITNIFIFAYVNISVSFCDLRRSSDYFINLEIFFSFEYYEISLMMYKMHVGLTKNTTLKQRKKNYEKSNYVLQSVRKF